MRLSIIRQVKGLNTTLKILLGSDEREQVSKWARGAFARWLSARGRTIPSWDQASIIVYCPGEISYTRGESQNGARARRQSWRIVSLYWETLWIDVKVLGSKWLAWKVKHALYSIGLAMNSTDSCCKHGISNWYSRTRPKTSKKPVVLFH